MSDRILSQAICQKPDMIGGCSTAAAHHSDSLAGISCQNSGKVIGIALENRPVSADNRITGIGHQKQRFPRIRDLPNQMIHMPDRGHAVETDRIDRTLPCSRRKHISVIAALAAESVGHHGKGADRVGPGTSVF